MTWATPVTAIVRVVCVVLPENGLIADRPPPLVPTATVGSTTVWSTLVIVVPVIVTTHAPTASE